MGDVVHPAAWARLLELSIRASGSVGMDMDGVGETVYAAPVAPSRGAPPERHDGRTPTRALTPADCGRAGGTRADCPRSPRRSHPGGAGESSPRGGRRGLLRGRGA